MITNKYTGTWHFFGGRPVNNYRLYSGEKNNATGPDPFQLKSGIEPFCSNRKPKKRVKQKKRRRKHQEKPCFPDRGEYQLCNFQRVKIQFLIYKKDRKR